MKELARSCGCGGDDPTHALPPRRGAVTQPSQLEAQGIFTWWDPFTNAKPERGRFVARLCFPVGRPGVRVGPPPGLHGRGGWRAWAPGGTTHQHGRGRPAGGHMDGGATGGAALTFLPALARCRQITNQPASP
jgi:hypothetical protein